MNMLYEVRTMRTFCILTLALFALSTALFADEYHSTIAGGWWGDHETWQSATTPGPDDDVYIHGIVYVAGAESCNNLHIIGADAMLKCSDLAHGTVTVYGDISSSGWVSNSASYNLTVNLYGDLSLGYHFIPHTFNWLGSGNRNLHCSESWAGIKTRNTTTIAATIDTIFATSDISFSPGGSYSPLITGDSHQVVFCLYDAATRTAYNLESRSCRLDNLKILGNGSSQFNFNNDSNLGGVNMQNCHLENLVTTGAQLLAAGNTGKDIINNGAIYNSGNGNSTYHHYGYLINNGQIGQAPHGYSFTIHTYGDVTNNGLFNPSNWYLKGPEARTLQSSETYPFKAIGAVYGEAALGDIHTGDQLWFMNIPNLYGPINFKAYTIANQPKTISFANLRLYQGTITGMTGSILYGNAFTLDNTPVSNLRLEGTLSVNGDASFSEVVNYATLENSTSGSNNLVIQGDFSNYGTVRNNPGGHALTVKAWDDVRNYGTWTANILQFYGDDAQNILFGEGHPFAGNTLADMNSAAGLYVVEDDLYIQAPNMDLNNAPLYLTPGNRDLYLNGTVLLETQIHSDLNSSLYMSNNSYVSSVSFQSITNAGILNIGGNTGFSGDLVNLGTIQNHGSSPTLTVQGNLVNNGTIRNNPGGYSLSVVVGGNVTNTGTWAGYSLALNGSAPQLISFPQDHAYTGTNFTDSNSASAIHTNADLYFTNVYIDTNGASWQLQSGRTAYNAFFDNSAVNEANFLSTLASTISMVNGGQLNGCGFQSVTLAGTINLTSDIGFSGDLVNNGIIQNHGSSITLTIGGNATNNGTIRNNPGGYSLYMVLGGNAVNSGEWSNNKVTLNSAAAQYIHFPAGHGFTGSNFYDTNVDSALNVSADLYFTNTYIDLNLSPLILSGGHDLILVNCSLIDAVLQSDLASTLNMTGGGSIQNCSFQSITLAGIINLVSAITISGDLTNMGIIQNQGGSYHLYLGGNLINQGEIRDNPAGYSLYLHCLQHITNSGTISNHHLYLDGTGAQNISNSGTMGNDYLTDTNAASPVALVTDLTLSNTYINLNNASLILNSVTRTGKTLSLTGGYLSSANVLGGNGSKLIMGGACYLSNVSFDEIIWEGTILVGTGVSVGTLHNYAAVMNLNDGSKTLTVNGNLTNYSTGSFSNFNYSLTLHLYGDLENNGALANYMIEFKNTVDQYLNQGAEADTIRCGSLRKTNSSGDLIMHSDLRLKNCYVSLNGRNLVMQSGRTSHALMMNGGYITGAHLASNNYSTLLMYNGAYLGSEVSCEDLIWQGTILLAGNLHIDNLNNQGTVMSLSGYSSYLYIYEHLDNHGTLTDNGAYPLYLRLYGHLYDYAILNNRNIYFQGNGIQNLYQHPAADSIRCQSFQKTNAEGDLNLLTDLRLVNCYISLNGRSLMLQNHTLAMNGGYVVSTLLDSPGNSSLDFSGGAYLNSVTCGNLTLEGTIHLIGNVTMGNVINNAALINLASNSSYIYAQRFDNYGSTADNGSYPLYLVLYGDLYDYGYMSNRFVRFANTTDQFIYQAPGADAIRCQSIQKTNAAGDVVMLSDLRLVNCYISLNGKNLVMQSGRTDHSLTMEGGYIQNTYLSSPGNSILNLSGDAYLNGVSGGNLTWQGTIYLQSDCTFDSIVNYAYARNQVSHSMHMYVTGDLVNHGTILSDNYPLYLHVGGHLTNNGTLANRRVYLNGALDQNIQLNGSETIEYLTLLSGIGTAVWYRNGEPSGLTGSTIDLTMAHPLLYGSWQPYVASTNTWGRTIAIIPLGTLNPPQNLMIMTDAGGVKLRWDQVAGASSYTVYASADAMGAFTVLQSGITDPDPGDGIVEQVIPVSTDRRFFKVTASN